MERFAGEESVETAIEKFVNKNRSTSLPVIDELASPATSAQISVSKGASNLQISIGGGSFTSPNKGEEFSLPLTVWIDDEKFNIDQGMDYAKSHNVDAVYFETTALAKAWVEENEGMHI
jgi:hypothetical protein